MTFAEFFQALWGAEKRPFDWQERLADQVVETGWPSVGVPTAAGKTALLDIAVYALVRGTPTAARRIFFVVDRRVIVDEASERARAIARRLRSAEAGTLLGEVAAKLRNLGGNPDPLEVAVLRGGIPRSDVWVRSPIQPTVICSTVDQVGSSILFRAYGTNAYNWPIRAALVANDSLIILDEAHVSQPFAETLDWISRYRSRFAQQTVGRGFNVVEMSATPRTGECLSESEKDLEHPVLNRRWTTSKRAKLVLKDGEDAREAIAAGLTEEARRLRADGAKVIGVIANRVQTARRVHGELATDEGCCAILLTGRARPWDRDQIWARYRGQIELGRQQDPEQPIYVVSTQCIEVGANIDFDSLTTEIASIDALEQRFGRLNRSGARDVSKAAIVAAKEQTKAKHEDAVYGTSLTTTWKWLEERQTTVTTEITIPAEGKKKAKTKKVKETFVEMGVLALRESLQSSQNRSDLTMPRRSAPVLLPAHLDLLCQTSPEPAISPEPGVFLHGPESGPPDVSVVWRTGLNKDNIKSWARLVTLNPPTAAEALQVPIWAVKKWLAAGEDSEFTDLEGVATPERLDSDDGEQILIWDGTDDSSVGSVREIVPGMTIVVPALRGGCDEWGWNPESRETVTDIGDVVRLQLGQPMLRLNPELASQWNYIELAAQLRELESAGAVRKALQEQTTDRPEIREITRAIAGAQGAIRLLALPRDEDGDVLEAISAKNVFEQSTRSTHTIEVALDEHLNGCFEWVQRFAKELPEDLLAALIQAAESHDIGKVDPRFQAWLRGGYPLKPNELLAKSGKAGQNRDAIRRARELAGYPKGARHELLSVALLDSTHAKARGDLFDLVLHLVAAHHGRCRPFAPVVEDASPVNISYNGCQVSTAHGLERVGSGISERFWRLTERYGWYGLAYLETLVRLADQRRSEAEQNAEEVRAACTKSN